MAQKLPLNNELEAQKNYSNSFQVIEKNQIMLEKKHKAVFYLGLNFINPSKYVKVRIKKGQGKAS